MTAKVSTPLQLVREFKLASCLLVAAAAFAASASAQTVINYAAPDADTYTAATSSSDQNYGTSSSLKIRYYTSGRYRNRSYVRFDLFSGGNEGSFTGQTITDASVTFRYASDDSEYPGTTVNVYGVNPDFQGGDGLLGQDWGEEALTADNAPWPGSTGALPDYITLVGSFFLPGSGVSQGDPFSITGEPLVSFLNDSLESGQADPNLVTFILFQDSSYTGGALKMLSKESGLGNSSMSVTVIPEPGTYGLIFAAFSIGLVLVRRRK